MCELKFHYLVEIIRFYLDNWSDIQVKMEFIEFVLVFLGILFFIVSTVASVYYAFTQTKFFLVLGLFSFLITVFGTLELAEEFQSGSHHLCVRRYFVGEEIDTVVGYIYEYEYRCYRIRGTVDGGYAKYIYWVPDVDTALFGEYEWMGSFACKYRVDTGWYYVIVPRSRRDKSIILLGSRVLRDTIDIQMWLEQSIGDSIIL